MAEKFICKNGCEDNKPSEENLEYCIACEPDMESDSCNECNGDDVEWDWEKSVYYCNNCGNVQ